MHLDAGSGVRPIICTNGSACKHFVSFAARGQPVANIRSTEPRVELQRNKMRLMRELETNIALRVADGGSSELFDVSGRGELHLAILVETLRREGFEFQVSRLEIRQFFENLFGR